MKNTGSLTRAKKTNIIMRNILACFLLLLTLSANAGTERWVNGKKLSDITGTTVLQIQDEHYNLMNATYTNRFTLKDSRVRVKLYLEDVQSTHYNSSYTVTVNYKIKLWDRSSGTPAIKHLTNESVTINFSPTASYEDIDIKEYKGFQKAEIYGITVTAGSGSNTQDIRFDLEQESEKFYKITSLEIPSVANYYYTKSNELELEWNYIEGAESYDVEWVFVDIPTGTIAGNFDFANATRINTTHNHYRVSMAYPRGLLVFRVRGVEMGGTNYTQRVEGEWSVVNSGASSSLTAVTIGTGSYYPYYQFNGMEIAKNWQYSVSYAEDGKRKEIISYFDGSLRSRQETTVFSTDCTAVTSQTIYDFIGRGVLTLLPAPPNNSTIDGVQFYPTLTKDNSNGWYDYNDFDLNSNINSPGTISSTNSNGAGFYYSSSNTANTAVNGNYIPDAKGYPYVRTTYKADGTNRPIKQGMAGDVHAMGGGKETKYYYGTPATQAELDRLFGNEVGFVTNYKKNMVIDPNGVCSVSYLDLHGRVIATALCGDAPSSMNEIDTKPSSFPTITEDIGDQFSSFDNNGNWSLSNTFLVPATNTYTFHYELDAATYTNCMPAVNCKYDLFIEIKNDEGTQQTFFYPCSLSTPVTSITLTDIASVVSSGVGSIDFCVTLPAGSYTVNKVLSINQASIATYLAAYNSGEECLAIPEPVTNMTCNPTCEQACLETYTYTNSSGQTVFVDDDGDIICIKNSNGTYPSGYSSSDEAIVQALIDACEENCGAPYEYPNECDLKLELMRMDMSPGGQYFDNLPFGTTAAANSTYFNGLVTTVGSTTFWNNLEAECSVTITTETWQWLRDNWQDCYADYLVTLHPEYSCYERSCCEAALDYDQVMFSSSTNPAFYSSGSTVNNTEELFNPLNMTRQGNSANTGYQPFDVFATGETGDGITECVDSCLIDQIEYRLLNYMPLDETAGSPTYFSLWYLIEDPDNIAHINGNSTTPATSANIQAIFDQLHGTTTTPGLLSYVSEYEFFRSVYKFMHDWALYQQNGGCTASPDNNGLDANGFMVRFQENPIFENMPCIACGTSFSACDCSSSSSCDYTSFMNSFATDICNQNCEEMADTWMAKVEGCSLTVAQKGILRSNLINICKNGCSTNYPGGSDNVATGNNTPVNGFYTFDQALNAYSCTQGLIKHPVPAYSQAECQCVGLENFINSFYIEYNLANNPDLPSSLSSFSTAEQTAMLDYLNELLDATEEGDYTFTQIQNWQTNCNSSTPTVQTTFPTPFNCGTTETVHSLTSEDYISECEDNLNALATSNLMDDYYQDLAALKAAYKAGYLTGCFTNIKAREDMTMSYELEEYHYTLYYYDQANNLIKTTPPEGLYQEDMTTGSVVHNSILGTTDIANTQAYRNSGTGSFVRPQHVMITNYIYNTFNNITYQTSPELAIPNATNKYSHFWYDALGRIAVSQNPKQAGVQYYSYTRYDDLGRMYEAGELKQTTAMTDLISRDATTFNQAGNDLYDWIVNGTNKRDVTQTWYDASFGSITFTNGQGELRNRIASVTYEENYDGSNSTYDNASHYAYDELGNVKELVQENKALEKIGQHLKNMLYEYDIVSGNVNKVSYQPGKFDEFYHKYEYDSDNRIKTVHTSSDNFNWEKQDKYFYYHHGPLARVETGDKIVQAQDYAYTINGWQKMVNSSVGTSDYDMGKDGKDNVFTNAINRYVTRDVYGYSLHYFDGDYQRVNTTATQSNASFGATANVTASADLYNGNIKHMITALTDNTNAVAPVMLNTYKYDQLNRLKGYKPYIETGGGMRSSNNVVEGQGSGNTVAYAGDFREIYTYDGNGNIFSLKRNGNITTGLNMDDLTYTYKDLSSSKRLTNRLDYVADAYTTAGYTTDIESQSAGNYTYDEIGQLTSDALENINNIVWNVKGKVRLVRKNAASKDETELGYDAMGHRIMKIVKPRDGSNALKGEKDWTYTFYTLDAQGNVMATYERVIEETTTGSGLYNVKWRLKEQYIYGSQRIGQRSTAVEEKVISLGTLSTTIVAHFRDNTNETKINWASYTLTLPSYADAHEESYNADINSTPHKVYTAKRKMGEKSFELSNHLGNVMEVISDRRKSVDANTYTSTGTLSSATADGKVDYYYSDVLSYNDYFPFGMLMPGRTGTTSGVNARFGFQGQEKDDEIKGPGNSLNYEYRMHDPRIGRFLSVDPLSGKFAFNSPYAFSENRVIDGIELEGLETISSYKVMCGAMREKPSVYSYDDIAYYLSIQEGENVSKEKWEVYEHYTEGGWLGYTDFIRRDENGNWIDGWTQYTAPGMFAYYDIREGKEDGTNSKDHITAEDAWGAAKIIAGIGTIIITGGFSTIAQGGVTIFAANDVVSGVAGSAKDDPDFDLIKSGFQSILGDETGAAIYYITKAGFYGYRSKEQIKTGKLYLEKAKDLKGKEAELKKANRKYEIKEARNKGLTETGGGLSNAAKAVVNIAKAFIEGSK